jgi:hypothetical protein
MWIQRILFGVRSVRCEVEVTMLRLCDPGHGADTRP